MQTIKFTKTYWEQIELLSDFLLEADAVLIGAGAGLSACAGFSYDGKRFRDHFDDFILKYGFTDMYSASFYPFERLEEHWAFWSRFISLNRYDAPVGLPYIDLLKLVSNKDYFVLTTNVDHQFQKAGFEKQRLFYTQGDYGLWQCSVPCCQRTYENRGTVERMVAEQKNRRIPSHLLPYCPECGASMRMNLRVDNTFVEEEGWHRAQENYQDFLRRNERTNILYLELGVGENTPGIIKYPFWRMTDQNKNAVYASVNHAEFFVPAKISKRSIAIESDIGQLLKRLKARQDREGREAF